MVEPLCLGGSWIRRRPRPPTEARDGRNGHLEIRPGDGMFPLMLQAGLLLLGHTLSEYLFFINKVVAGVVIGFIAMGLLFYSSLSWIITSTWRPGVGKTGMSRSRTLCVLWVTPSVLSQSRRSSASSQQRPRSFAEYSTCSRITNRSNFARLLSPSFL